MVFGKPTSIYWYITVFKFNIHKIIFTENKNSYIDRDSNHYSLNVVLVAPLQRRRRWDTREKATRGSASAASRARCARGASLGRDPPRSREKAHFSWSSPPHSACSSPGSTAGCPFQVRLRVLFYGLPKHYNVLVRVIYLKSDI